MGNSTAFPVQKYQGIYYNRILNALQVRMMDILKMLMMSLMMETFKRYIHISLETGDMQVQMLPQVEICIQRLYTEDSTEMLEQVQEIGAWRDLQENQLGTSYLEIKVQCM